MNGQTMWGAAATRAAPAANHTVPTLVFDLDGTLSDPFDGIWRSVNHALECHGRPALPADAFHGFVGPPIDQSFRALVPDADEAAVASLVERFRERYGRIGYAENTLYPDIPEALTRLRRAGFVCGVCTNKRRDFALQVLDLFELRAFFAFVSGGDVGVRKADQLARLLASGTITADAVMIGDRASDLEAAHANGLRAVGVAWGFGSKAELAGAAPCTVCRSPSELAEWLIAHAPGTAGAT